MPVIPGINKDITLISKDLNDKIHEPKHQRNLVLIIVCIALLLDNMLYMVIVPIIPEHLHKLEMEKQAKLTTKTTLSYHNPHSTIMSHLVTPHPLNSNNNNNNIKNNLNKHDKHESDESSEEHKTTKTASGSGGGAGGRGNVKPKTVTAIALLNAQPQPKYQMNVTSYSSTKKNSKQDNNKEDVWVGLLFASKAMVQLLIGPFSGAFIDRTGYDLPMCMGLGIIFLSTLTFSFASSYSMLFLARSLQGVGSAFADTSGLAMIADRFTEEGERSKALGIALAFISFGCLVAPPFGGFLYQYTSESVPFISLAFLALFDGIMLLLVMRPHNIAMSLKQDLQQDSQKTKGTPIWKLLADPYIAVSAGALVMANVSLAFLEPTIAIWMKKEMNATESQIGFVWLPGFIPHVCGVYFTVWMSKRFPQHQWILATGGLALEGVSCFFIPFCTSYWTIMIPISGICFGIALVDTAILPTLGYLVDVRHTSVYGSIYAIADISYSLAYAFGPIVAGNLMHWIGFTALNMIICFSNLLYAPVIYFLRYFYEFKPLESNELSAISNNQSAIGGAGFKRFVNEDENDFQQQHQQQQHQQQQGFNPDYTAIDGASNNHFNNNYQSGNAINKPESANLQNLQKYPRKQTKNPYKETHNLIDNMEQDDY